MKKFLFVALLAIFGLQLRAAEQFDELDLLGGWQLVSCNGTYDFFTEKGYLEDGERLSPSECEFLYVGDIGEPYDGDRLIMKLPGWSKAYELNIGLYSINGLFYLPDSDFDDFSVGHEGIRIMGIFISNGNKLQILTRDAASLRFVIESLNDSEMRLRSFDGRCEVTYKRIGESGVHNIATDPVPSKTTYYNMEGMEVSQPSPGLYVEKNGQNFRKVLK